MNHGILVVIKLLANVRIAYDMVLGRGDVETHGVQLLQVIRVQLVGAYVPEDLDHYEFVRRTRLTLFDRQSFITAHKRRRPRRVERHTPAGEVYLVVLAEDQQEHHLRSITVLGRNLLETTATAEYLNGIPAKAALVEGLADGVVKEGEELELGAAVRDVGDGRDLPLPDHT